MLVPLPRLGGRACAGLSNAHHVFLDGGIRSGTNADLAQGHDPVLVLTPMDVDMTRPLERTELPALEDTGSTVAVLRADEDALDDMGPNPLDPAMHRAAYEAGRRQG